MRHRWWGICARFYCHNLIVQLWNGRRPTYCGNTCIRWALRHVGAKEVLPPLEAPPPRPFSAPIGSLMAWRGARKEAA